MRNAASRSFTHHTWPNARNSRCSGVKPSIFFSVPPIVLSNAISAMRTPPLSAVFSPSVSLPFTIAPGATSNFEYSRSMQAARCSNSLASSGVHQSRRFPLASNCRPSSLAPFFFSAQQRSFRRGRDPSRTQLRDADDELHRNLFSEWEVDSPLSQLIAPEFIFERREKRPRCGKQGIVFLEAGEIQHRLSVQLVSGHAIPDALHSLRYGPPNRSA